MDDPLFSSDEEINATIQEILSGKKIYFIEIIKKLVFFSNPDSDTKLLVTYLENRKLNELVKDGLPLEADLDPELVAEFFSSNDEEKLGELNTKISAYEKLYRKRQFGSKQAKDDLEKIEELKKEQITLSLKKNHSKEFTANYHAREEKYFQLMSKCILDFESKRPLWASAEEMIESFGDDSLALYSLLNDFLIFYMGLSVKKIRKIARHPLWINYYIYCVKANFKVFSQDTKDLSIDQLSLLAWSSFYRDIGEMSLKDRPPDELIENDEGLDNYLKEFSKKLKAEAKINQNSNLPENQDMIVTAESSNYIQFHKDGSYSDTKVITGRTKDSDTTYDRRKELRSKKRK